jgi:tetratricopeptide (TPR) repeat protein
MEGLFGEAGAQLAADVAANQDAEGKLRKAEQLKGEGNDHFIQAGKLAASQDEAEQEEGQALDRKALYFYHSALMHAKGLQQLSPEDEARSNSILGACYANLAAVQLRQKRFEKAAENCTHALAVKGNENNAKVLFRRGKARLNLKDLDGARNDLESAQRANPGDKLIQRELALLARKEKISNAKSDAFMKNMFAAALKDDGAGAAKDLKPSKDD